MTQKTLLALGGSRLLVPVIEAAHALGHRVVTCDYLPDNYAHQLSDAYRNVSIVDHDAVLETARDIDAAGIVSFAADPGVTAAAYAVEQLNLPKQISFDTAVTLQTKHLFREFLARNDFPSPRAWIVTSSDQAADLADELELPVIVKPVDAAGSKGVTRVDARDSLRDAVTHALSFSQSSSSIIETFIETDSPQRSAEGFAIDGEFVAVHFMDQLFDAQGPNPYAPIGNVLPSTMSDETLQRVTHDLQRISTLLGFGSGIFNIEVRVANNGTPFIVEISPRGGGNRLAEFIQAATGQNLIRATVQAAVGDAIDALPLAATEGTWIQEMLFSRAPGVFRKLRFDKQHESTCLHSVDLWAKPGDRVESFSHATYAIGSAFSHFAHRPAADTYLVSGGGITVDVVDSI